MKVNRSRLVSIFELFSCAKYGNMSTLRHVFSICIFLAAIASSLGSAKAEGEGEKVTSSKLPGVVESGAAISETAKYTRKISYGIEKQAAGKVNASADQKAAASVTEFVFREIITIKALTPQARIKEGGYKIEKLSSPPRLVIDLPSSNGKISGISTSNGEIARSSQTIAKIRVGMHSNSERIVLDLASKDGISQVENYSATLVNGDLKIILNSASAATAPRITLAASSEPSDEAPQSALRSLTFAPAANGGNMLVAELDQLPVSGFNIKKTAPSEYVLNLPQVTLDQAASSVLVAPPLSGIVRSARPVSSSDGTKIRIFVAPEATISARIDGKKVLIGQFSSTPTEAELMAQLADETKSKDAKLSESSKPFSDAQTEEAREDDLERVASLLGEEEKYVGRLISLDLQDTDIDNALRIIAEVSNLNIIASEDVTGKITLRLIDVPWDQALDVILKTNGLDKVQEGNVVRIAPVEKLRLEREALKQAQIAQKELKPLLVEYIRISYARASELKPLVETVLTERGSVAYDERTNQIIVKDIDEGVRNVAKLVSKLDLRTPQILLETQIVEANRSILRELGSILDFSLNYTPETGNATGSNFPNSVVINGGLADGSLPFSNFPATSVSASKGGLVSAVLESADGTKSLGAQISSLEEEGKAKVVSRPSVATTNNKPATIKSVEKIRIKLPDSGLSVATGAGATANGGAQVATEVIEIGIVLDVTPQASPDYYVLLDIRAKSSTLGNVQVDNIPSEIERSANSTVLVSSGQTFAMGGIYKIQDNEDISGIPFLKDIPVLGTFFRFTGVRGKDEELLFFLTPRIIEGSFDDAAMRVTS
jgi:type IV pilus assembly protein PilQ